MRQAVFVVVMVAAAFLGGAAVNGPGVRWVQARLLEYLGVKEGEIASVDLPEAPAETADSRDPGAPATAGGPTANPPSVTPRGTPGKGDATRAPGPGPEPADVSSADRTRSRPARTGTPAGKSATESGTATPSGVGNMLGSLLGFKGEDGAGQAA